jgi:hypothetical protein
MMSPTCPACGEKLVYRGRGRPRKYCEACVPSGSGGTAWHEAWLREHHDELKAERRRKHAEWMAEWRASMAQRKRQIARNRRALEAKSRKTVA